jgi:hypothetical protein
MFRSSLAPELESNRHDVSLTILPTVSGAGGDAAALAFTAYGVHWFAMGWDRLRRADPRVNVGMSVAFLLISILGVIAFFKVHDARSAAFIGLACVYAVDFVASLKPDLPKLGGWGEQALGFFHLGTGFWLMYLVFAVALNLILNYALPI